MVQQIITYTIVALAVFFLAKKFFFKPKSEKGCDTNCGCS
ncbi:MAG: FeoB-associated Cys-rich membrane protein [Tenacibaculum sp.]|nr:FeoB-associated Cys-rich membrane protein [Tenacibaculum sp.]